MALRPVERKLVPDEVFDQLLNEVVTGDLAAGDSLPSERRLAEMLGVSRPAVREALQRMSQTRLVEVRHGGTTTVRDFTRYAGLDLLTQILVRDGRVDPAVGRSIVEARTVFAPAVAGLAAQRKGPTAIAALDDAVAAIAQSRDAFASQQAALEFWDLTVDLADSIVFRLMFNSLRLAYEPAIGVLAPLLGAEIVAAYRCVADAIGAGDAEAAKRHAEALLRPTTESLTALFDQLEADSTDGATDGDA